MLKGDPKLQFLQNLAYFEDVSKFIIIRKASLIIPKLCGYKIIA